MSEIGRELGQVSLHIDAVAIPPEKRNDGQSMAKIMQARPSRIVRAAKADLARQFDECPSDAPFRQAGAVLGYEKARAVGIATEMIPTSGVSL
jgi:hypothetical protein